MPRIERAEALELLKSEEIRTVNTPVYAIGMYYSSEDDTSFYYTCNTKGELNRTLAETESFKFLWHKLFGLTHYGEVFLRKECE